MDWAIEPNPVGQVYIEEIVHNNIRDEELSLEERVHYKLLEELLKILLMSLGLHKTMLSGFDTSVGSIDLALAVLAQTESVYPQLWEPGYVDRIHHLFVESNLTERLRGIISFLQEYIKKYEILLRSTPLLSAEQVVEPLNPGVRTGGMGEAPSQGENEVLGEVQKFKKRLEGKQIPEHVKTRINEELNRLAGTHPHHAEVLTIRTYLELMTAYPWGTTTPDSLDIDKARTVLNETHYGMDDVKQRILEIMAVSKLRGKVQGKIMCFVGPPGVGKTSIGEGVAK